MTLSHLTAADIGLLQATTGVIQGTVQDPSGAVIAGADVSVKELETNLTRQLKTDSNGRFVFLALPPGSYVLTVAAKRVTQTRTRAAVLDPSTANTSHIYCTIPTLHINYCTWQGRARVTHGVEDWLRVPLSPAPGDAAQRRPDAARPLSGAPAARACKSRQT